MPIAYCLLPIAFSLLPFAFSLLPFDFDRSEITMVEDPQIHQLAYQLFLEEVPGLLETIQQELLQLDNSEARALKVNNLMRATHTIKGGAANLGLKKIERISHRLEDILRALYNRELRIDSALQTLLFDSYEYLQLLLSAQIEGTKIDEAEIFDLATSYLEKLEERSQAYLGDRAAFPTSEELGLDPVKSFFETVVPERLQIISKKLEDPDLDGIVTTLKEQLIVFRGMGKAFELNDFVAIAQTSLTDLDRAPERAKIIAKQALNEFQKIRTSFLEKEEREPTFLTELLSQFKRAIDLEDSQFYLNIIKCILGWFHRYENIPLNELSFDDLVPSKLLENSQELEAYIDSWLGQFTQYIELMKSETSLNLYRQLTSLKAILELIKFQDSSYFEDRASQEKLPIIAVLSDRIAQLESEYKKIKLDVEQQDWLKFSYIEDFINVIDNLSENSLDNILGNTDPLELFCSSVTETKIKNKPEIIPEKIDLSEEKTKIESPSKPEKELTLSTVRVKIGILEKINYLAGELSIEQNKNALNNEDNRSIIDNILAKNKQTQQILNQLCNWFDLTLMFPGNNSLQTFSSLFPKVALNNFSYCTIAKREIEPTNFPSQPEEYEQIFKILKNILEETNNAIAELEKVKNHSKKFNQSFKKKQRMLFNMRAELIEARMTPLSSLFARFYPMIEQLSSSYEKKVELKLSGSNILVDKAIEQRLYQPLLHLIRNAFAHGIESQENRIKKRKSPIGLIEISAYYQGSKTILAVRDDGQGINLEKVKKRAVELNLITAQKAKKLSESQILEYLFEPGFSTSSEVDFLSGRGVGLDIVRSQLEALKGNIVLESKPQEGTTFYLQIPLTLSIAKLMVCQAGGIIYSVVSNLVQKIIQPNPNLIELFQQQKILRLNLETEEYAVPVYQLSESIEYSSSIKKRLQKTLDREVLKNQNCQDLTGTKPILLLKRNNRFLGLEIDRVLGKQELVIRPLGSALTPPSFVYGCSILSDGSLSLVIDGITLIEEMGARRSSDRSNSRSSLSQLPASKLQVKKISSVERQKNKFKVLLMVEDSLQEQNNIAKILKKEGYQIIKVGDEIEAIEKLAKLPTINLIICDLDLPRTNGFEFLKSLGQNPQLNQIPKIVLTSNETKAYRDLVLELGANDLLNKSSSKRDLLDTVARSLFSTS